MDTKLFREKRKGKHKKMCACDFFLVKLQCSYLTLHSGVKARGKDSKLIFTKTVKQGGNFFCDFNSPYHALSSSDVSL